jgi:predicted Rossmann fold flavoprotein
MTHAGKGVFDVAVVGAGAAGMMAASIAGQRGLRVVLVDHAARLAEKIRISGGGRCNFTNIGASPANFVSQNPDFCRSALAAYTPNDFIGLLKAHRVAWHEKHKGQLFCDESSEAVIELLRHECDQGGVAWRMPCSVMAIGRDNDAFALDTSQGRIKARQLVMACGGMAIPQLGASDFALATARRFGLKVVEPRPALVPLTFDADQWRPFGALSGVALEVAVGCGQGKRGTVFLEDLLFTHRGLSGPAILQISTFWNPGEPIQIDLASGRDLARELLAAKPGSRQLLGTVLAGLWPRRLADRWLDNGVDLGPCAGTLRLADAPDKLLRKLAGRIHAWSLTPSGTAGYKKAEVMRGGVDTRELNQKTMQAKAVPGLYFIGEAVDVTGWLGGYNFQWAWASGAACGRALLAA